MDTGANISKKAGYNVLYRPSEQPYERITKTSKPNQTKQIFMLLGLVALVVLIPILLISLLTPETIFETRRHAAEDETYYGLIQKIMPGEFTDLPFIGGFYLADTNGNILDTDPSEEREKFILFPSTQTGTDWETYANNNFPENILPDSISQITGSSYWMVGSQTTVNESKEQNHQPSVSIQEPLEDPAVEQEFRLNVVLTDPDSTYGDYVKNVTTNLKYLDETDPNWNMSLTSSVIGKAFPQTVVVAGTPTSESEGKKLKFSVTVTDILGFTSEVVKRVFTVPKHNTSPVIESFTCSPESVTFETGCPTTTQTDQDVVCTVIATDADGDELSYGFTPIPYYLPVQVSGDELTFTVSPGDSFGTHTIEAQVWDCTGCAEVAKEIDYTVSEQVIKCPTEQAPTAVFTANPSTGSIPLTVTIDPSGSSDPDGTVDFYNWTFGDGQQQTYNQGITFNHTYDRSGIYTLTLEVVDNDGLTDTYSTTITAGVNEEPLVTLLKPNIGSFSGSKINPNNRIIWQVSDPESDSPLHYEINLLSATEGGSCDSSSLLGTQVFNLTYGNLAYDSTNESYYPLTFEWDTQHSLSGEVPDGHYCVRISVSDNTYGHSVLDYSDGVIEIQNAEHPPVITTESIPDAIKGQAYSTQILAYDDDDDPLQFNMIHSPNWISINTEGRLFGTPNESGPFNIIIAVTDGKSERSRSYTLNVKATEGQVLPAITLSASAEVFIGSDGKINWSMTNDQYVATLDLEYSTNGIDWTSIVTGISKDENEYIWDVSELEPGKYNIRLVYYDAHGNKLGASDVEELEIAKPETTRESAPNVFNFKPADGDTLSDATPVISANFSPSRGAKVDTDTVRVYIDNELVNEKDGFEGFEGGFAYIPVEDFSPGLHTVKAGFKDTEGKIVDEKWSFTITSNEIIAEAPEEKVDYSKYLIAGGTIFITALLTVIAYFLVKKINEDKELKQTFAPKMFATEKKDKEFEGLEKVYKGARASLERTIPQKPKATPTKPVAPTAQVTGAVMKETLPPLPRKVTEKSAVKKTKPIPERKPSSEKLPEGWQTKDKPETPKPINVLK